MDKEDIPVTGDEGEWHVDVCYDFFPSQLHNNKLCFRVYVNESCEEAIFDRWEEWYEEQPESEFSFSLHFQIEDLLNYMIEGNTINFDDSRPPVIQLQDKPEFDALARDLRRMLDTIESIKWVPDGDPDYFRSVT